MTDFFLQHAVNGVWYGIFKHLEENGLKHGISTRLGGVSQAPYRSLNLGIGTKDAKEAIWRNRELFCEALGLDATQAVTTYQVHGDKVHVVTAADAGQKGVFPHTVLPDTDALITNVPGIPLMLFFADCVPIIIYDPVKKAVGVCHAGWKGTMANIAAKTLGMMQKEYGTNPCDCLAAVAPSIGPCCYEVDQVVIDSLIKSFPAEIEPPTFAAMVTPKNEKWLLNLWEVNRIKLTESGILAKNIAVSSVCTACNTPLFFSHRAENGTTGRFGVVACL
ncbi:MAG: peptidoglycan editing factor PgeF [Sporomusaceae bacterium]|nr:peptidoglycan editing factor PgeF [Sporomusaceae bacterium]